MIAEEIPRRKFSVGREVKVQKSFRAIVSGEHRTGSCEDCGMKVEKKIYDTKPKVRMICPKCGGQGRLIARSVSIQAPDPPQCIKPRCLWHFFWEVVFSNLLSTYHSRRMEYAEKNRNKEIPGKYRTGKDCPMNIRQAIFAITVLKLRR